MTHLKAANPVNRFRWYMPTPGKFVAFLLLGVVALYLSDQYDWFAFNKQKGWTVLMAVATVAIGLGLIVVWSAGAWLLRRRLQFGLLVLLLMVPTMAVPCAWLTREMQKAKQLANTVNQIEQGGGNAYFFLSLMSTNGRKIARVNSCGATPSWLRKAFGEEFFGEVGVVFLGKDNRLSDIASLHEVRELIVMKGVPVDDAALDAIVDLPLLEVLHIDDSEISDAGLPKLLKATALKEVFILESKATRASRDAFERVFAGKCYMNGNLRLELERLMSEVDTYSSQMKADSNPAYDDPYSLEYRAGPSPQATQEMKRLLGRDLIETPEESIDLPDGVAPETITPEAPGKSALEDLLEI